MPEVTKFRCNYCGKTMGMPRKITHLVTHKDPWALKMTKELNEFQAKYEAEQEAKKKEALARMAEVEAKEGQQ